MKDYAECLTRLDTLRRMTHDACLKKNWEEVKILSERMITVAVDLKILSDQMMEKPNG